MKAIVKQMVEQEEWQKITQTICCLSPQHIFQLSQENQAVRNFQQAELRHYKFRYGNCLFPALWQLF